LAKLEPGSALGMNISQRIPGQVWKDHLTMGLTAYLAKKRKNKKEPATSEQQA